MDKGKKINWKNDLLLSAVSYLLYIIIWLVLDYETARQLPEMALIDYMVDFLLCMLFTYTSLGFCYIVYSLLRLGDRIFLVPAEAHLSGCFRYDLTF